MLAVFARNKGGLSRPIHPCNRTCSQSRIEGQGLINEGQAVVLFHHPLNVRRISYRVGKADRDAHLGKEMYQVRMG